MTMTSPNSPPAPAALAPHPTIAPELVPERRGAVAILSHTSRDGDWILPRLFRAVAFMGNVELDLTRALVAPGTSQIDIRAIMGSVTIVVPPDLRLDCTMDPVIGSAEVSRSVPSTMSPDAPMVRITGTAFLGSIEVKVVDPNAPSWLDKVRGYFAKSS